MNNAQRTLVKFNVGKMLEKWKSSVDRGRVSVGALLTDLYKAFDCLDHKFHIAKLNVYGFTFPTVRLVFELS